MFPGLLFYKFRYPCKGVDSSCHGNLHHERADREECHQLHRLLELPHPPQCQPWCQPYKALVSFLLTLLANSCGLYYKHTTIVNFASSIVNKPEALLTDDSRVDIYDRHVFIVQATCVFVPWNTYSVRL